MLVRHIQNQNQAEKGKNGQIFDATTYSRNATGQNISSRNFLYHRIFVYHSIIKKIMHFQLWLIIKQINHIIHLLNAHSALLSCPNTTFTQQCGGSRPVPGCKLGRAEWGARDRAWWPGQSSSQSYGTISPSLYLCSSCDSTQCEEKVPTKHHL